MTLLESSSSILIKVCKFRESIHDKVIQYLLTFCLTEEFIVYFIWSMNVEYLISNVYNRTLSIEVKIMILWAPVPAQGAQPGGGVGQVYPLLICTLVLCCLTSIVVINWGLPTLSQGQAQGGLDHVQQQRAQCKARSGPMAASFDTHSTFPRLQGLRNRNRSPVYLQEFIVLLLYILEKGCRYSKMPQAMMLNINISPLCNIIRYCFGCQCLQPFHFCLLLLFYFKGERWLNALIIFKVNINNSLPDSVSWRSKK